MGKKLTYEFVKSSFEKEGYTLLSKEYKNNKQKLKYICPNGHEHSINFGNWAAGNRCVFCMGYDKKTIEFIKKQFEKEGYKLLTKNYRNNVQKLQYICPEGHKHSICWSKWQQGVRCFYCFGNVQLSYKFIRESFKKEGYKLLTKEYKNTVKKLNYVCPIGHKHSISWDNWKQGKRCAYCSKRPPISIDIVKESFKIEGCTLLSKKYKNCKQTLNYICYLGHKNKTNWDKWKQEHRCRACHYINNSGENNPNWKGGISCEPYCQDWTKEYKKYIKERDGNKCLNPCCLRKIKKLSVHHINYVKKDCMPENLITICVSCNSKANKDRKWHEAWYKAIINKRYKGGI